MHGRKKQQQQSEADIQRIEEKAKTYKTLVNIIMKKKCQKDYSLETFELTDKMLRNNPDFYSLWNIRRIILIKIYEDTMDLSRNIPNVKIPVLVSGNVPITELSLTQECIKRNPKSYGAWYHRKWIVNRFEVDLESEMNLCVMLLKEDQRNFNCWNYRRHIATLENIAPHTEFTFSGNKIKENFSNYSAFHHRSFYFRSILNSLNYNDQFNEEFSIVENAIFTEPDDQSAWWYHQFLIRTLSKDALSNTTNVTINSMTTSTINDRLNYFKLVLESQINVMNSLLELESNSKWARVCLVELYSQLIALPAATMITSSQSTDELVTKRSDLLTQLVGLDATHAERYKYLLRKSNSPSSSSSS